MSNKINKTTTYRVDYWKNGDNAEPETVYYPKHKYSLESIVSKITGDYDRYDICEGRMSKIGFIFNGKRYSINEKGELKEE